MSDQIPPPPGGFPPPPPSGFGAPPPGYAPYGPGPAPGYPTGDYAGFWARLGAKVIDGLILGLATAAALAPAFIALVAGPSKLEACTIDDEGLITNGEGRAAICEVPTGGTIAIAIVLGLLGAAALIALYVYYFRREGRTGQTWGREATNIRLVDAITGLPIGGGRAFGRYVFASTISGWICYLGYLWMLWDPQKQTWHDKVVTSVVVKA